eukprot:1773089-Amphidinium_carterae.1
MECCMYKCRSCINTHGCLALGSFRPLQGQSRNACHSRCTAAMCPQYRHWMVFEVDVSARVCEPCNPSCALVTVM